MPAVWEAIFDPLGVGREAAGWVIFMLAPRSVWLKIEVLRCSPATAQAAQAGPDGWGLEDAPFFSSTKAHPE